MNKLKYILLMGVFLFAVAGCEFGTENDDPNNQVDVALKNIMPAALTQAAFNQASGAARISGIFMQHFRGFGAQQLAIQEYKVSETALNGFFNFGLYAGVMKDAAVMIEKGVAEEQPHYVGIAKILMANALGHATTTFGDVPYSEAFNGVETPKPVYDTQESNYASIQTLLDEAIVELSKAAVTGGPSSDDLIFGGDVTKWIATAHAMKARYFMHLTKRDNGAAAKALAEVAGAMSGSADQPDFVFDAAIAFANPLAQFGDGRPNTLLFKGVFEARLAANNDPRKALYTKALGIDWLFHTGDAADGLFWANNDSPMPLISYTEVKFIEAEALVRSGGAGANAALQAAISSNMDYTGVAEADRDAYLANVADISALADNAAIQVIIEEAYVAYYGQAESETWVNYRRTGFPALVADGNGVNANNPSGIIPRRIPYPQGEKTTNQANLDAAIARQGADLADTDMWAFK